MLNLSTLHEKDLPLEVKREIRLWNWALTEYPVRKPVMQSFKKIAKALGVGVGTVKRKYYKLKESGFDYNVLIDARKITSANECHTKNPHFVTFVKSLVANNQRSGKQAIDLIKRMWLNKQEIPGYEDFPGWPNIPEGWSYRNLSRLFPTKHELNHARFGVKTASKTGPQVFSTRVGVNVGEIYQFDDVWHDNYVRWNNTDVTRVLELGCLDLASACRISWGSKPRIKRNGKYEQLKEREMRFLLGEVLFNKGFYAGGCTLIAEHGTAAIQGWLEDILHSIGKRADGSPLIQVRRSAMEGARQALGIWEGRSGGNPRSKAALESSHNLIHNTLGCIIGQTGKDYAHMQESTHGVVKYQEQLLKAAQTLLPERVELLEHPLLDFHSQFLPLLNDVYAVINGRKEHNLEGWAENVITQYRLDPHSTNWLGIQDIPEETQDILHSLVRAEPRKWSNTRKLSPSEVWTRGQKNIERINQHTLAEILGRDLAKPQKVKGAYIKFNDVEISSETLVYDSRVQQPNGRYLELKCGETYEVFSNPFNPEYLLVCDSHFRCIGVAKRVKRAAATDHHGLKELYGKAAVRERELIEPMRKRHQGEREAAANMRDHNDRVITGKPVTEEEHAAVREITTAKRNLTRRTNAATRDVTPENLMEDIIDEPAPHRAETFSPEEIADFLED